MRITAGSREVPGRNTCDRRHTYCIIIIIIIIIIGTRHRNTDLWNTYTQTTENIYGDVTVL